MTNRQFEQYKSKMVCLGLDPWAAGWKAQTNPLSYGGTSGFTKVRYSIDLYIFQVVKGGRGRHLFHQKQNVKTSNKMKEEYQMWVELASVQRAREYCRSRWPNNNNNKVRRATGTTTTWSRCTPREVHRRNTKKPSSKSEGKYLSMPLDRQVEVPFLQDLATPRFRPHPPTRQPRAGRRKTGQRPSDISNGRAFLHCCRRRAAPAIMRRSSQTKSPYHKLSHILVRQLPPGTCSLPITSMSAMPTHTMAQHLFLWCRARLVIQTWIVIRRVTFKMQIIADGQMSTSNTIHHSTNNNIIILHNNNNIRHNNNIHHYNNILPRGIRHSRTLVLRPLRQKSWPAQACL